MKDTAYSLSERVLKYIITNHLLTEGDAVVVGLSGGPDSVCLLHILNRISDRLGIGIEAVHIHHGIRGVSADKDELFCTSLCREMGIKMQSYRCDIPKEAKRTGESLEECARRIRYELLKKHTEKYENGKIAVAHHIDDQAETVLFRMIRGTGVKGLSAMRPQNENIIRPLLCMSRYEVMSYMKEEKLSYCTDETNLSDDYSRNRIRLNIIPEAEKISPNAAQHIADLSEEAAEMADYIDRCSQKLFEEAICERLATEEGNIDIYSIDVFLKAERVIVLNALRKIVNESIHSLKDITRGHIESIYRLLNLTESKSINLPKNLMVTKEGNELRFHVKKSVSLGTNVEKEQFCNNLKVPGSVILPDGRVLEALVTGKCDDTDIPQKIYTKWLDYDNIKGGLCLRFRQSGDYLIIDDKGTKKSLSRYMIDEKIPKSKRDSIPLLVCGSEVLWVIGYRISAYYKIGQETKNIIRLEVKGEGNE